jgi:hypothetical protein
VAQSALSYHGISIMAETYWYYFAPNVNVTFNFQPNLQEIHETYKNYAMRKLDFFDTLPCTD